MLVISAGPTDPCSRRELMTRRKLGGRSRTGETRDEAWRWADTPPRLLVGKPPQLCGEVRGIQSHAPPHPSRVMRLSGCTRPQVLRLPTSLYWAAAAQATIRRPLGGQDIRIRRGYSSVLLFAKGDSQNVIRSLATARDIYKEVAAIPVSSITPIFPGRSTSPTEFLAGERNMTRLCHLLHSYPCSSNICKPTNGRPCLYSDNSYISVLNFIPGREGLYTQP